MTSIFIIHFILLRMDKNLRQSFFFAQRMCSRIVNNLESILQTEGGMASLNLEHCLNIPDDFEGYSKTLFNIPKHYEDCVGNVLIPAGLVQVRILQNQFIPFSSKNSVISGSYRKTCQWHFRAIGFQKQRRLTCHLRVEGRLSILFGFTQQNQCLEHKYCQWRWWSHGWKRASFYWIHPGQILRRWQVSLNTHSLHCTTK